MQFGMKHFAHPSPSLSLYLNLNIVLSLTVKHGVQFKTSCPQGLDDERMKGAAIDIFSYIVEYSPSMVREFALHEAQTNEDVHDVSRRTWQQEY